MKHLFFNITSFVLWYNSKYDGIVVWIIILLSCSPHIAYVYTQVSKSFMKGKTSMEEYISHVKSVVQLSLLMEAIVNIIDGGRWKGKIW